MDTKGGTTVRGTTVHITHTPNTGDTAEAQGAAKTGPNSRSSGRSEKWAKIKGVRFSP